MKASSYLVPTAKEDPQDAVVASHKLMIRAGLVRKSSAGLYFYLPLGLKILRKIEQIVREEMDRSGALEFQLPILTPADFWKVSGRWDKMGKEMFRLKDRHDNENCLGPTHEESFCNLVKPMLKSYKDLPINVYQIHTKFRDEIRPRFGVIRSREFTMKDAYSYHIDDESLDKTYQVMRSTYRSIFKRMGLSTIPVQADSGNMGGSASEEFMVVSPIGEETLMICKSCGYNGNIEKTPLISHNTNAKSTLAEFSQSDKTSTPNAKSISEVSTTLGLQDKDCIKALALVSDDKPILVFLLGDRELNEAKLRNHLKTNELRPMGNKELEKYNLVPGFIGPQATYHSDLTVILDASIDSNLGYVAGANELDYHYRSVVMGKSHTQFDSIDCSLTRKNDPCPNCGTGLDEEKGIEVGHIFKLGQKYTEAFDIKVLDQNGKTKILTMGCYGIGVNRCMATIIEQCNDEKGIHWPITVAPFEIALVSITKAKEDTAKVEKIYQELVSKGLDVFWDDRDLGPGFKFKDSELIGFPIRITIGKAFLEKAEISILVRKTGEEILHQFTDEKSLYDEVLKIRTQLYQELEDNNHE
ncbi:proline--tRNA ligase [Leptospira sp. GIMC2001]|uniref:proline--tRNA ligase n=1 Tax=Leptospira sp. GIMC2001 TaxID=1513297 RepID=UPI00234B70DA|nr:proline--tRNA ligase [Leptospira sp. GIMC2001]WCL48729.1 proline--tRNA ligase [Leptospira sp. GIMC2001]